MNYKITHTTTYSYSTPVSVCQNLVMLTPRDEARVHAPSHRLTIHPTPHISARRKDAYGNVVHAFSIDESHKQLTVTANSRVRVSAYELPSMDAMQPWEQVVGGVHEQTDLNWLDACRFVFDSPRVTRSGEFAEYARSSFISGRAVLDGALDLTARIYREFAYHKGATSVSTSTAEAFRIRKGVCQDFAHIEIACLRSLALPARYVSGYLRTTPPPGKPRLIGADESHAWVSVYCGAAVGWVDIDPTNNCICSIDHIPIAWGRDYGDVVPLRGVFLGGGEHQLDVSVDVSPLDDDAVI